MKNDARDIWSHYHISKHNSRDISHSNHICKYKHVANTIHSLDGKYYQICKQQREHSNLSFKMPHDIEQFVKQVLIKLNRIV